MTAVFSVIGVFLGIFIMTVLGVLCRRGVTALLEVITRKRTQRNTEKKTLSTGRTLIVSYWLRYYSKLTSLLHYGILYEFPVFPDSQWLTNWIVLFRNHQQRYGYSGAGVKFSSYFCFRLSLYYPIFPSSSRLGYARVVYVSAIGADIINHDSVFSWDIDNPIPYPTFTIWRVFRHNWHFENSAVRTIIIS